MKLASITRFIEEYYPLEIAEKWDNVGLLIGDKDKDIKKILITLDITNEVMKEAKSINADLIISHHPLIFSGLKKILSSDSQGNLIINAVENKIAVYSSHTNCDISKDGLNDFLCKKLNLINLHNLSVLRDKKYKKFVVYVPEEFCDKVIDAASKAGAGHIGNYSSCTFSAYGEGTFRPHEGTNPYIGTVGELERVKEARLETIVPEDRINKVINSVLNVHPYEEVAYDVFTLENKGEPVALGRIGYLDEKIRYEDFLSSVKHILNLDVIKYSGNKEDEIQKIAICTGSGGDLINECIRHNVDVFITGEIKYHQVLEAQSNNIKVIQAGHYETEIIFTELMYSLLKKEFDSISLHISKYNNKVYNFS